MRFLFLHLAVLFVLIVQRTAAVSYVGEIYFVVDLKLTERFMDQQIDAPIATRTQAARSIINKEILYVVTETNKLLASLTPQVNFELRIVKLEFLDVNVLAPETFISENVVISENAMTAFKSWLDNNSTLAANKYDLAVLLTGFDIGGTNGLGDKNVFNFGGICTTSINFGVSEFQGTYSDVVSFAKGLGVVLGAGTDGITSSFIMATENFPSDNNRWKYSTASVSSIKDFLAQLSDKCLTKTSASSVKPSMTYATYTGDMLKPDVICQRSLLLENSSSQCKGLTNMYNNLPARGDALCKEIFCYQTSTDSCVPTYASDGMICDKSKRCVEGQCKSDNSAVTKLVDANCVLGDQKLLHFPSLPYSGTCVDFILTYGEGSCYIPLVRQSCCDSCKDFNTGIRGCEFSDRSNNCVDYSYNIEQVCPTHKSSLCCETCYGYVGKQSGIPPVLTTSLTAVQVGNVPVDRPKTKFDGIKRA